MAQQRPSWFNQPSWWIVTVAGGLFLTFSVAIVRELMNGHQVRQQVQRLETQVASEADRQRQLQDLIDYLGSPTFQEQEARLKLGLKKTGEQVIVIPPANLSITSPDEDAINTTIDADGKPLSNPQRWWQYFFGPRLKTLRPNA